MSRGLPLALTLGEPAGIGPDLTLELWRRRQALDTPAFYVAGDADFLRERARLRGFEVALRETRPEDAAGVFADALPVVPLAERVTAPPGRPDASSAPAAVASIRTAVEHVLAQRAAAVVTNPIAKAVLYRAGFEDPGHTEYLARLAQEATGRPAMPVMLLWSPVLAVVPVTIHIPLREVVTRLTRELIVRTGRIVAEDMGARFALPRPRLAVAGLNPHAGEGGSIGREDAEIVAPAVADLRADGINARGPLSADTLFHAAARATYDVALCMYHDQALIPIKTLAFDHGVNVTLGLPFVRTSPDHGTAFDLAGTDRADPSSLLAALKLAARMAASTQPRAG
jgi:4-hydroxythreonine-4-phosphate dehydrogenase